MPLSNPENWRGKALLGGYHDQPEKEQAALRIALGAVALVLYIGYTLMHPTATNIATVAMVALYVLFGVLSYVVLLLQPRRSMWRLAVTTCVDQGMVIAALAIGGRSALPLLFVVFWFLVGAGCRYGKGPLALSCAVTVFGMSALMGVEPWWMANRPAGIGLVLGVAATSLYLYVLVDRLERRAATDALTGLQNRSSLDRSIERAQATLKMQGGHAALLLIDLDGFKEVNDSFGHAVGDELLLHFARMLARDGQRGDTIARLGGDEFVVLSVTAQTRVQARTLANAIHANLEGMRQIAGHPVSISASIGICMLDGGARDGPDNSDVRSVMKQADRAMYLAKELGKKRTAFADELAQNDASMNAESPVRTPSRSRTSVLRQRR